MLKIRLQRIGRKNDPSFRVVVTEHTRGPKSEKHVDRVGFYNPKTKEQKLEEDKIKGWIEKGAQASGTVHNMLVSAGIVKGDKVNVLPQKSPVVKEEEAKEEAAPAAAEGEGETPAEAAEKERVEEDKKENEEAAAEAAPAEEAPVAEEAPAEEAAPAEEEEKKEE